MAREAQGVELQRTAFSNNFQFQSPATCAALFKTSDLRHARHFLITKTCSLRPAF
jgi:hypothetical protein